MLRSHTRISLGSSFRSTPFAARRGSLALFAGLVASVLVANLVSGSRTWGEELKTGDRVVFLGDSITQGGVSPKGYVTLVGKHLQETKKDLNVEIIGAGISGNKVPDLEKRLERDVLSKKPTIVVIYIGINDVWHSLNNRGTSKEEFQAGLKRIIDAIQKGGARVVLCTPSVIGEKTDGSNKLDTMLEEYSAISRGVATETKSQLLDLRQAFMNYLKKANDKNQENKILTTDGVHLNDAGNKFVADQMLTALGAAPKKGLLRHVVLFKFKAEVTAAQAQEVADAFAALPKKIDAIEGFEWGTDVSVENKSEGLTHGFVVTFRDEKGRDEYLPHPAHQEFVKLVGPRVEKVIVFDYWVR